MTDTKQLQRKNLVPIEERNGLFYPDAQVLKPTWDHAFKSLFLDHKELTLRFIEDFIEFEHPITDLTFLSNDIESKNNNGKSVRLDVALRLADGTLIDLEMQTSAEPGYLRRCVYYNAMLLVSQTKSGSAYSKKAASKVSARKAHTSPPLEFSAAPDNTKQSADSLPNVMSLTLLSTCLPQLPAEKFRHSFQLLDGTEFLDKDCFRIDLIELPKLRERISEVPERQRIWLEFFLARSYAEVKQLGEQDTVIRRACEVLEMMSEDEKLKDLARRIWQGEFARKHIELLKKEEEEQKRRLAEEKERMAEEEKRRVEEESRRVEEEKRRVNEEKRRVDEEKRRVDEEKRRVEEKERMAEAKVSQANTLAIRTLAEMGLSSNAIAEKLELSQEHVIAILNSND